MSIISMLLGEKKKSAALSQERLQLSLARECVKGSSAEPYYLPALQRELMAVVSKYVSINPEDIKVNFERQDNLEVLEVKVELPEAPATAR